MRLRKSRVALVSCLVVALVALCIQPAIAKPTATFTIRTDGGWSAQNSTVHVLVAAAGTTAKLTSSPQHLVDTSGLNVAWVAVDSSACQGQRTRYSDTGTTPWCLTIVGLDPGSDVAGTVKGAGANFKLTVSVRDGLARPIACVALSLIIGILLTWLTTDVLPRSVGPPSRAKDGQLKGKRLHRPSERLNDARSIELRVVTAAAVLATGAIAAATALSTVYGANNNFGTGWDYLALATSAVGSSALAGILTAILLLLGKKPATDATKT